MFFSPCPEDNEKSLRLERDIVPISTAIGRNTGLQDRSGWPGSDALKRIDEVIYRTAPLVLVLGTAVVTASRPAACLR